MKLRRLTATNVFGHLSFSVSFHADLTFLVGLNGSGKTTALRILMGLLTPAVDELAAIHFERAELEAEHRGARVTILAEKDSKELRITLVGTTLSVLRIPVAEQEILLSRRRDSGELPIDQEIGKHEVYRYILEMATPMFLGIERRLPGDEHLMRRSRTVSARLIEEDYRSVTKVLHQSGLADIQVMIKDVLSQIRRRQEAADSALRQDLLRNAVQFSEFSANIEYPDRHVLATYRNLASNIRSTAEVLNLPAAEVGQSLSSFVDKMDQLYTEITSNDEKRSSSALISWAVNQPQLHRLSTILGKFQDHTRTKTKLNEPVDRLIKLLNQFFSQTKREVSINSRDMLTITTANQKNMSLNTLSSGERQLCILLTCLTLAPHLKQSGIFIVDEPELSLHLSWQEMFVDAVITANPDVQLILATHSPAIVAEKADKCQHVSDLAG